MKKEEVNLFILITPFHFKQISEVKKELPKASNEIVFISDIINLSEVKKHPAFINAFILPIPSGNVSLHDLVRSPYKEMKRLQHLFAEYDNLINEHISKDKVYNLITGTDKDTFVQSLLRFLIKNQIKKSVIAVDEGIGFYKKESQKSKVIDLLYKCITPIFFNRRLNYIERLGSSKEIDAIYVRLPEIAKKVCSAPSKVKPIVSAKKKEKSEVTFSKSKTEKKALFLTAPLSEDRHLLKNKELDLINGILEKLEEQSFQVDIKQHPREVRDKLASVIDQKKVQVIDQNKVAEELGYQEYNVIINIASSVIIDLLISGYPSERIITIDPYKTNKSLLPLYHSTTYIPAKDGFLDNFVNALKRS